MKSKFKMAKKFTILGLAVGYYALSQYCKNKSNNIQVESMENENNAEEENRAGN